MVKIIEAADLPLDEKVMLTKDMFGWRVVEPPTKWWHYIIGSKRNLAILIVLLLIAGMFYLGVTELISGYKDIALNPCNYCSNGIIDNMKIDGLN